LVAGWAGRGVKIDKNILFHVSVHVDDFKATFFLIYFFTGK
jgi:hypothetical protein